MRRSPWTKRPLAERFWEKAEKTDEMDGCWLWRACLHVEKGYGLFQRGRHEGGCVRAHRQAWLLTVGPIPPGMHVLHRCDNPPCVRPGHLFLGTQADNMHDMLTKGRHWAQKAAANDNGVLVEHVKISS